MTQSTRPSGMTGFTVVWVGQMISMLGTGMTRFALTIWAWQLTGSATALALVGFFSFGPIVLFSPIAGALVDRWNRKLVMMLSDLAAGMSTVAIFVLYATGHLEIWHLYVAGAFAGTFESFQWPAYSAAITTMVDKKHYARASGMLSLAESISGIAAPGPGRAAAGGHRHQRHLGHRHGHLCGGRPGPAHGRHPPAAPHGGRGPRAAAACGRNPSTASAISWPGPVCWGCKCSFS